jgi:hypothetical protein
VRDVVVEAAAIAVRDEDCRGIPVGTVLNGRHDLADPTVAEPAVDAEGLRGDAVDTCGTTSGDCCRIICVPPASVTGWVTS